MASSPEDDTAAVRVRRLQESAAAPLDVLPSNLLVPLPEEELARPAAEPRSMLQLGCSADRVIVPNDGEVSLEDLSLLGQPTPIDFETYDNSRQVVHPSAVAFTQPWHDGAARFAGAPARDRHSPCGMNRSS